MRLQATATAQPARELLQRRIILKFNVNPPTILIINSAAISSHFFFVENTAHRINRIVPIFSYIHTQHTQTHIHTHTRRLERSSKNCLSVCLPKPQSNAQVVQHFIVENLDSIHLTNFSDCISFGLSNQKQLLSFTERIVRL